MSQTNNKQRVQKLQIRNKKGTKGKVTVGANTEVLLDGHPVSGVSFIKIEIGAKKTARVVMELYAEVEVDAINVKLNDGRQIGEAFTTATGKHLALYELGSYNPKDYVFVKKE